MLYQYDTLKIIRSSFLSLLYNVLMLQGEVNYLSFLGEEGRNTLRTRRNIAQLTKYS